MGRHFCHPTLFSRPVSRVLSSADLLLQTCGEMVIYLARELLHGSSDLTRPDTDVFTVGASNPWIGTYLVLLRVEIAAFHPAAEFLRQQTRLCGSVSSPSGGRPLAATLLFGARTFLPCMKQGRAPDLLNMIRT